MIGTLRMCLLRSGPTRHTYGSARSAAHGVRRRRLGTRPPRPAATAAGSATVVQRLGREAVADAEVRVDVAPARRRLLELLAQLAHEDVDRAVAVGHRVAPDALVDLLALEHLALGLGEQLDQLELAPRQVDAERRRRRPGTGRRGSRARRRRTGPPRRARASARRRRRTTASTRAISSSGWHGLVTQSSAPSRSPRTRWATVELAGADDDAERRQARRRPSRGRPSPRAEHREVDDERVEAHRRRARRRAPGWPARGAASPAASRRLVSTCRKPESESITAEAHGRLARSWSPSLTRRIRPATATRLRDARRRFTPRSQVARTAAPQTARELSRAGARRPRTPGTAP